ncbi:MAG TPA: endonuclease/exonuclease/phosphatase family protein [Roseiflexaceae bacterium]|nr:endonuclease/exonuclease/phosphatase family protein [Roseiflexaceae bacterium]
MHQPKPRIQRSLGALLVLAMLLAGLLGAARPAQAAGSASLAAIGALYSQNFDILASSGTSNLLPLGWDFAEAGTSANSSYSASTGSSTAGDTYSFGAVSNSERAFGALQSGTLISTIGASFTNNTGATITQLAIGYTGEQWRLGTAGRADRLDFQFSTDAITLTAGSWLDQNDLDFTSPVTNTAGALDGNAAANRSAISGTIAGLNIANGAMFWIRWTDFNASGGDDGLAIDDFSLTPSANTTAPTGAGSASPSFVVPGGATRLTMAVTPGANPTSSGIGVTGDLSSIGGSAAQPFFDDGSNGDATAGDNIFSFQATVAAAASFGSRKLPISIADAQARTGASIIELTVLDPAQITRIHTIQGAGHLSPLSGQVVLNVQGIVTARRSNGFYLQDPAPADNDATSEGIFVFTSSAPAVSVGDLVNVGGTVTEFRPGSAGLTTTEISAPSIAILSSGNSLPAPVVIGGGGRLPPTSVIEDDAAGNVESSGSFDPANDGIDFYESLEGMRVQVNDAVAVGPTSVFGGNREIPVLGDDGANAGLRSVRGGIVARADDFNPERIILNDLIAGGPNLPIVNVGDHFDAPVLGVLDYSFDNYKLQITAPLSAVAGALAQETTRPAGVGQLAVATFNVENLDPADGPAKFNTLAGMIVNNLKAPDIVALEEIQDNNGPTNDATVDAASTYNTLIAAISAAGGPTYQFRQVDPVDDQDGGEPGGNIRQGFLFRTDRGLSFVDRPGGTSLAATTVVSSGVDTRLSFSPGRIDPTNSAFSGSRKPLAGEFVFNGHKLFVIANHFNSKGADQPLYGRFQPPARGSETTRHQQAQVVHGFVQSILTADPNADVVVLGDLNDFEFSETLANLKAGVLHTLIDTLPAYERYTYVFEGNSQAIDHILLSNHLFTTRTYAYDVVHVNSEFAAQASDHEPQVVRIAFDVPPVYLPLMRR